MVRYQFLMVCVVRCIPVFCAACLCVLLSGCSDPAPKSQSAEELYAIGQKYYKEKKYKKALKAFEEVDSQHPHSTQASSALMLAGDCALQSKQYSRGVMLLDLFIEMHPMSPLIEKAFYWRSLCHYGMRGHFLTDQSHANNALAAFNDYLNRFPQGEHINDIKEKRLIVIENGVKKDMAMGRFYQKQRNWVGALRAFSAIESGDHADHFRAEALYESIVCFGRLGMHDAAQRLYARMQKSYANSPWLAKAAQVCVSKSVSTR
jgi:outer membrane protein assembly factor BamD